MFKNQLLKEQEAFLKSESLLVTSYNSYNQFNFSWEDIPLIKENNATLFGKRMEVFLKHCIHASNRYTLIAAGVQLIKDKVTKGELDFLIQENSYKEYIHVELAYKFYLLDPKVGGTEINQWIGPNRNDSLVKKLHKLTTKQFPLLHTDEGKAVLKELQIETIKQELFLLGKLYVPFKNRDFKSTVLNQLCVDGYWMTYKEFETNTKPKDTYFIPRKFSWHMHPKTNTVWLSKTDVTPVINAQLMAKKAVLVWKKTEEIYEKIFVVWW